MVSNMTATPYEMRKQSFYFYLTLINLHVNRLMWLVATKQNNTGKGDVQFYNKKGVIRTSSTS
jgi:hypothetical protein